MKLEKASIAFIGGGMMGGAMLKGVVSKGMVKPKRVVVADPITTRGEALASEFGIRHTVDNVEAVQGADVVVLAVKPQFFDAVAKDIGGRVSDAEFVLSIMAGVATETIDRKLETNRIVRAMPNTPAAIGAGMTAWMGTEFVDENALHVAEGLLAALGETLHVPKEIYLDMATAVSGSGPAYVLLFIEAMVDAAVHMGFSRVDASKLVLQTVQGTVSYALETGTSPTTLRNQVTSPGGTTAEALYHMEREGLRSAVARGMWGAFQRSVALGGGEPRNPDTSE